MYNGLENGHVHLNGGQEDNNDEQEQDDIVR